jgi:pimeloyl-ACP methyl ester carboxylesterase
MNKQLTRMTGIIVLMLMALVILALLVRQFEPRLAFFPFAGEDRTPAAFDMPFRPLTLSTSDGERLHAWHLPRADAVAQIVYFHGNGGNLSVWSDVLVGLVQHGYEVIAIDYRGFGLSTGSPTEQGLYRDVDATLGLLDGEIRRRELPVIYWGRSIGTAMAAYAASRRPPDGVVLEAGFPSARAIFDGSPIMLALTLFATYRFPTADWMARVTAPTLVLHGNQDSVIPYGLGQRLYASLPGPKRFVTIEGGDHNDPAPRDAEAYWGAVRQFITSTSARP